MTKTTALTWSLLILCAPALAVAETVEREFNESFAVSPGDTLRLLHGDGDVEIEPGDGDRMEIHVRYHVVARGIGGPRDFEVDFARDGDVIRVEGREIGRAFTLGSLRTHEHRYVVTAPPYVALDLRGDDGDVRIADWAADVAFESSDGDVHIDGLTGNLSMRLDDGDVDLYDCDAGEAKLRLKDGDLTVRGGSGSWDVELDDGDFDARDLAAETVLVTTEDGDVELALLPAAALDVDVRTDDGDVILELPSGAAASFDLHFDDGSVRIDGSEASVESKREHRIEGVWGGGGNGRIDIDTGDGDIVLLDGR